ncbi:hypothetical protein MBANPS3_011876 [Mucor bainieri]
MAKVFFRVLEENGNMLDGAYNEVEYTFFFLYPIIKKTLYDVPINFKLGESHLQCAIKKTNDDEAADAGPKIDIIMTYKRNNLPVGVVEVSGSNHKVNKNHYVGDRNKIAKNLKSIIGSTEKASITPDILALKKSEGVRASSIPQQHLCLRPLRNHPLLLPVCE